MLKKFIIFSILLFIAGSVYGGLLKQPPPLSDSPPALSFYLKHLYDNIHKLPITTTSPDGSRQGERGELILFNSSGTFQLFVCTSVAGGTAWQQIQ